MKMAFLVSFLALFSMAATAKPTIAVLDFDIEKDAIVLTRDFAATGAVEDRTKMLSSELITFLVNTRKFDVIERDRVDAVLREQTFSSSGMVDSHSAIQIGKLIGAEYLVMGRVEVLRAEEKSMKIPYTSFVKHTTRGDMVVNMRIVDGRTGKIVAAKKVKANQEADGSQPADVFLDLIKETAVRQMVTEIIDGVFPVKVVSVSETTVFLNRGEGAASFSVGDRLDVFKVGESLIDPDTGEALGHSEVKIAEIIVTSIQQRKSGSLVVPVLPG